MEIPGNKENLHCLGIQTNSYNLKNHSSPTITQVMRIDIIRLGAGTLKKTDSASRRNSVVILIVLSDLTV